MAVERKLEESLDFSPLVYFDFRIFTGGGGDTQAEVVTWPGRAGLEIVAAGQLARHRFASQLRLCCFHRSELSAQPRISIQNGS